MWRKRFYDDKSNGKIKNMYNVTHGDNDFNVAEWWTFNNNQESPDWLGEVWSLWYLLVTSLMPTIDSEDATSRKKWLSLSFQSKTFQPSTRRRRQKHRRLLLKHLGQGWPLRDSQSVLLFRFVMLLQLLNATACNGLPMCRSEYIIECNRAVNGQHVQPPSTIHCYSRTANLRCRHQCPINKSYLQSSTNGR